MSKTEIKTTEIVYQNPNANGPKKDLVSVEIFELNPLKSLGEYYIDKSDYYKKRQNPKPKASGK